MYRLMHLCNTLFAQDPNLSNGSTKRERKQAASVLAHPKTTWQETDINLCGAISPVSMSSCTSSTKRESRVTAVQMMDAVDLLCDQRRLVSELHQGANAPVVGELQTSSTEHASGTAPWAFVSTHTISSYNAEPLPSAIAENELLRMHANTMRDRLESAAAENDVLKTEVAQWKRQAESWKTSTEDVLRKMDRLRALVSSERADAMEGVVDQAFKFATLERKLEEARLHHVAAANRYDDARDQLISC